MKDEESFEAKNPIYTRAFQAPALYLPFFLQDLNITKGLTVLLNSSSRPSSVSNAYSACMMYDHYFRVDPMAVKKKIELRGRPSRNWDGGPRLFLGCLEVLRDAWRQIDFAAKFGEASIL
jgi:hypothetical protein